MALSLGAATAIPVSVEGGHGAATAAPTESVLRPSNPGGPGPAVNLTGDAAAGKTVFEANCQICHNVEGRGGNPNPGSADGTIPALNPIDPLLKSADPREYATNLDLFIEHGSTPAGPNPTFSMLAWGDGTATDAATDRGRDRLRDPAKSVECRPVQPVRKETTACIRRLLFVSDYEAETAVSPPFQ